MVANRGVAFIKRMARITTAINARPTSDPAFPGRKRDILRVFTEKVAAHGYDMTSLSEIAAELSISKGTIVHHFVSKDRMLQQLSLGLMQRRLAELQMIMEEVTSNLERIQAIILHLVTAHRDDRAATVAFSREFARFVTSQVMAETVQMRRDYTSIVKGVIDDGIAEGLFQATDSGIVALQIIGMISWSWTWHRPNKRLSPEQIARIFAGTVARGLLVDPSVYREAGELLPRVVAFRKEHSRAWVSPAAKVAVSRRPVGAARP